MTDSISTDGLFWTAARYAWGELSSEEAADFETRLANDEAACLALAEAVQLSIHLAAADQPAAIVNHSSEISQPTRREHRWAAAWLTVATLAIATAWFAMQQAAPPSAADHASTELLALWTDAGHLVDGDDFDDLDTEPDVLDESLSAPGWLVQAVQLTDNAEAFQP